MIVTTAPLPDARQSEPVGLPPERQCPFDPNELGQLRDSQPLSRLRFADGHLGWLVTSHEHARAVLGDQRFSRYTPGPPDTDPGRQAAILFDAIQHDPAFPQPIRAIVDHYRHEGNLPDAFRDPAVLRTLHESSLGKVAFANWDPPVHTRVRRLLAGYFTVRRVAEHRSRIEQIVDECLTDMERTGPPVDLVATFAQVIPSLLTCALFGIPEGERSTFERLSEVRFNPSATVDDVLRANEEFRAFARSLVDRARSESGEDLLTALVRGGDMTDDELVSTVVLSVDAAHATTTLTLAFAVATLLQDRDRWDQLAGESAPIGQVVEELLRYTAIVQTTTRTALEDVEIGGTVIRASESVAVALAAANRDPQVFAEPDQLDATRPATRHLTFGYGVHQCLGQHLVRLELEVALTGLARRFPTLDLAVPVADIPWHRGDRHFYGPQRLPVTW